MIRPDAIPVRLAASRVGLSEQAVAVLFGGGYRLRGTERVRVVAGGRREVAVPATSAPPLLALDPLDLSALGGGAAAAGLRLVGPRGSAPPPPLEPIARRLVLPPPLRRSWGLEGGNVVTLQAGAVAFGGVVVEDGEGAAAYLTRADLLAAGLEEGGHVRWRRELDLSPPQEPLPAGPSLRPTGRLITENDVRQARLHGQRIAVGPDQLITPAARSLGRELGVLDALPL